MNSKVVEIRREMLETWLQSVIQYEELLPSVFKFLDVSLSRMSFVMNMLNSVLTPGDDALVLNLAAQLSSEARQRLKALEYFDKTFFVKTRRLSEQSMQTVLAHLLPLCADLIVGAKSIYIVSKLIAPQHNRGYELFLHYLLRENIELLSSMDLQKHIRQEFQGDTSQFAFEILVALSEYFERTMQHHSLYNVLNYDTKALEVFNLRRAGNLEFKEHTPMPASSDWIYMDTEQFPSINFKYKKEGGTSLYQGSMVVNASVEDLLSVLVSLEARRKWDMFFEGGRVLEKLSDSEFTVLFMMNFEFGKFCYTFSCKVQHFSPTAVSFSLQTVTLPEAILPPGYSWGAETKTLYTIEALREPLPLMQSTLSTQAFSLSDNEQDDSEAAAYSDSEADLPRCIMTYELEMVKDSFAFTAAALEGRVILESWSRLKALVENQDLLGRKASIPHDTLQNMMQRKLLAKQVEMPIRSSMAD
jgi:hypothetical protein